MERVLGAIGLSVTEERLYRALLSRAGRHEDDVATELGVDPPQLAAAVAGLEAKGLLSRSADQATLLVPTPPGPGLEPLLLERERQLEESRRELAHARAESQRLVAQVPAAPSSLDQLVEVVRGRQALLARTEQLQRAAQHEVLLFDTPPYLDAAPQGNDVELTMLERGVSYRVVYAREAVEIGGSAFIEPFIAKGEQARVVTTLPMKLVVVDRRRAAIPLGDEPGYEAMALLSPSPLLRGFIELFERVWETALPLRTGASTATELSPDETRVVELLAAGMTDDAIARQLGVSRSTVIRQVARLMQRLHASSRFQAGATSVKRGWL